MVTDLLDTLAVFMSTPCPYVGGRGVGVPQPDDRRLVSRRPTRRAGSVRSRERPVLHCHGKRGFGQQLTFRELIE